MPPTLTVVRSSATLGMPTPGCPGYAVSSASSNGASSLPVDFFSSAGGHAGRMSPRKCPAATFTRSNPSVGLGQGHPQSPTTHMTSRTRTHIPMSPATCARRQQAQLAGSPMNAPSSTRAAASPVQLPLRTASPLAMSPTSSLAAQSPAGSSSAPSKCRADDIITVACVGDSLTYEGVYPNFLQEMLSARLPSKKWRIVNCGAFGTTAQPFIPYTGTNAFQKALSSSADIVVLLLGTNDAQSGLIWKEQDYEAALHGIAKRLETEMVGSAPKVILTVPPPLYPGKDWSPRFKPEVVNSALPRLVKNLGLKHGYEVVDAFSALGGHTLSQPHTSLDGCHLTTEGNRLMASAVSEVVLRVFHSHFTMDASPSRPGGKSPFGTSVPSSGARGVSITVAAAPTPARQRAYTAP
mmetsp:Transcript_19655/g.45808  ORF Transcript_19655/g.45808 Transcript_19655/m.45808 type:complete len:409 (-) Transcript_19655:86-1312(-)